MLGCLLLIEKKQVCFLLFIRSVQVSINNNE